MPLIAIDELKTLLEESQAPCLSIYMPTQKAGPDIRQNPIRFKNLIREAQERLQEVGMAEDEASEFLQPAQELDRTDFWEHQDCGLAIFLSPKEFRSYRLPLEVPDLVVVSDLFHFKPLLPLFTNNRRFYLLALSQKEVRFFEGTRYSIKEVEVENLPQTLEAALNYDETAKEGQFRIATSRGGTANSSQAPGEFHGQGSPDRDQHQQDILQFFHAIDDALHPQLQHEQAPLVLAAVEYLFPLYKEANNYQHLVEEGITGNPEILKPEELHERAWQIVEPVLQQSQQQVLERYQELAGSKTGKTSDDLKEIVPAAYFHRVDSLFVAIDRQLWGNFAPDTMAVNLHPEPEADDEDLLDFAAMHTLINGGVVYAVESEKIPEQAPAVAIFRY